MKTTLLTIGILLAGFSSASEKELTFYKDLTHYKELKEVELNDKVYITLTDTAVLDTFNVSLKKNENLLTPKSIEIHPKSEENIFKLNKNSVVYINEKKYTLIENGKGFIKVTNQEGLITFIPKSKIEVISFTNDINATSHIAQVIPNEPHGKVQMAYSYALGEMSWKPKYDLYLKDKKNIQLDYNIEINNETLTSFENVNVKFMLETISRQYNKFTSDDNGGIFDYEQYLVMKGMTALNDRSRESYDRYKRSRSNENEMMKSVGDFSSYNKVSSSIENGKRAFEFSNSVSIKKKKKTSYPFKNALEMSYIKENDLYISTNVKEKDVLIPTSLLNIKNKSGITLSAGVARIFSGNKGFESTVIKEHNLRGSKGNEDIRISIGENYGIKTQISKKNELLKKRTSLIRPKEKNRRHAELEIKLTRIDLTFDNIGKEDGITIKNQNLIVKEDLEKVKELLSMVQSKIEYDDYIILKNKLSDFYVKEEIVDLNKNLTKTVYLLKGI